jgi:hypothetical protein
VSIPPITNTGRLGTAGTATTLKVSVPVLFAGLALFTVGMWLPSLPVFVIGGIDTGAGGLECQSPLLACSDRRSASTGKVHAMITGTLIAESLRVGAELGGVPLVVTKISRAAAGDVAVGQPELWTFIEFEAGEAGGGALAAAFSEVLDQPGGWYVDFRTPAETFVVFAGRIFRYPRGDASGRAEAAAYGRAVGVPEDQLDWPK